LEVAHGGYDQHGPSQGGDEDEEEEAEGGRGCAEPGSSVSPRIGVSAHIFTPQPRGKKRVAVPAATLVANTSGKTKLMKVRTAAHAQVSAAWTA